jgi:hypothetical protein
MFEVVGCKRNDVKIVSEYVSESEEEFNEEVYLM